MRIRPYIPGKDYEYVSKWIDDERIMPFGVQIFCHAP